MSGKDERPTVMPAGAMPPEQDTPTPEPILGKFAGPEELVSGYTELEKKLGEQGQEVGSLKKMNQMLMEQLQSNAGKNAVAPTEAEADTFDYQAEIQALSEAVDNGDLTIAEALVKSNDLVAERSTRNAMSKYEELNQKKSIEQTQQRFLDENPDFFELKQTGALEKEKGSLPGLHDDFSAYYAFKARQAQEAVNNKNETDRIASGDERTKKVLATPGAPSTKIGKGPAKLSPGELKQQTLAKLAAMEAS